MMIKDIKTGAVFIGIILYAWTLILWYDVKAKLKRRAR